MSCSKSALEPTNVRFLQHLYALSDLAQWMIQLYAKSRSWTLTTIPTGKTKLPSDIFHSLPDATTANKVRGAALRGSVTHPLPRSFGSSIYRRSPADG